MLDLAPAAGELARLLRGITDDQLDHATPCTEYTLGDLCDHVGGLSLAFAWAAAKAPETAGSDGGPSGDATRLGTGWRARTGDQLDELALAWKQPDAWEGMTRVGGVDLPGEVAGVFALDELVVHGWDVAVASRQEYRADEAAIAACLELVSGIRSADQDGPFGPPVPVAATAPPLDRLLGLTGRDPRWSAS